MKKLIVSAAVVFTISLSSNVYAKGKDWAGFGIQTALNAASAAAKKTSKKTSSATSTATNNTSAANEQSSSDANVQKPEMLFSKDDASSLSSKIKTNLSSDDMVTIMNTPFHLIALQAPDVKFGQIVCLCGEEQWSLEQKKKIFGDAVVDPKGKWQTKIISFNKTNEDTLAIELDLMMRTDPTESPRPNRRIFYFRNAPGEKIYLVQMKAFGTQQGDMALNNDGSTGYAAERVFYAFYEGVVLFLTSGEYQFNGT